VARSFMEGSSEVDIADGATVEEFLRLLPREVREIAQRKELSILVNDAEVSAKEGLATHLHDGDELILFPIAHGGKPA